MPNLKSEQGFTLLEIIIGTSVLGILAVAVMGYWQTSTGALEDIHNHHLAVELAKNSIARMRAQAGSLKFDNDLSNITIGDLDLEKNLPIILYNYYDGESKYQITPKAEDEFVINETITEYDIDFERKITISDEDDPFRQKVKVKVSWQDSEIVLDTIIADKRNQEYALKFDGNDSVNIDNVELDNSNEFTVEFWFKTSKIVSPTNISDIFNFLSSSSLLVSQGTDLWKLDYDVDPELFTWPINYEGKLRFLMDDGEAEVEMSNDWSLTWNALINNNDNWHHIAGVFDGNANKLILYLDGKKIDEDNISSDSIEMNNKLLSLSSTNWGGMIKQLRVWKTAQTKDEIEKNMKEELEGGEEDLVGYWKLNEGTKTTVYDYARGNNGEITDAEYQKVFWWDKK